jgi:hypothetical protein
LRVDHHARHSRHVRRFTGVGDRALSSTAATVQVLLCATATLCSSSARIACPPSVSGCDALDGATDGLVQDQAACQAAFDLNRDVPTCTFASTGNVDTMLARVNASNSLYTESAMSFMTPPNPSDLSIVRNRGGKIMAYHGTSDPIFSSDDTAAWWNSLNSNFSGRAAQFARYFPVPGMNHCSGGPATDRFDMLTPLVDWVEKGVAPERVVASARGTGNAGGANADVPTTWAPNRTRPLCPYPKFARYIGTGSLDSADSFSCQ